MSNDFEWRVPSYYSSPFFNLAVYKSAPHMHSALNEIRVGLALNQNNETAESLRYVIKASLEIIDKALAKIEESK